MERVEIFYALLVSLNLVCRGLGDASSLYYSIFFLVSRDQNPMSIITFQVMKSMLE